MDPARCQAPLPTTPDPNLAGLHALGFWNVDVNCAAPAGLATLIPWTIALTAALPPPRAASPRRWIARVDAEVVTPAELAGMQTRSGKYNAFIQSEAPGAGMAYLDVNPTLLALVATGAIPPIPNIAPALAGQSVGVRSVLHPRRRPPLHAGAPAGGGLARLHGQPVLRDQHPLIG